MLIQKKIVVVMPAYNAARTLERTCREVPLEFVDEILLVDDRSSDETVELARRAGVVTFLHKSNMGYGRNQKTCYREALKRDADIVVMVHPDYQYSPKLILAMASMIACGEYDLVLGSRIIGKGALVGGMPLYKFVANRALTFLQNVLLNWKLSEYHTGFRAYARRVLETLPLEENSDDFLFDNEILTQAIYMGFRVGELSCPTRYFPEASSVNLRRSIEYGIGVLGTSLKFRLQKLGLGRFRIFDPAGRKMIDESQDTYYEELTPARDGKGTRVGGPGS